MAKAATIQNAVGGTVETFLRRAVAKRRARHTIGITCRSACSNRTVLHLEQCGDRRWRLRRRGGFADQDHLRGRIHQHGGIIAVQKRGWRLDVGAGYRRPWCGPAAVKRFDWSRRQSVHHLRQCRRPQWHEGWPSFGGGIWDTSGLTSADAGQATHWSVGANGIPALGIRMKAGNSSRPTSSEHTA